ncbi:MAG: hypothetical protein KDC65_00060 [Saprospiraceae bacterium]|nr:hypothetical protein [Saprospiraceae bacterium]
MKFRKIIRFQRKVLWALMLEGVETKQMLHAFLREGRGRLLVSFKSKNPSQEELQKAVEQLKDIPRFLPFFIVVVVPMPGVTEGYTLLAVTLEKWLGEKFRFLPSRLSKVVREKNNDTTETKQQP